MWQRTRDRVISFLCIALFWDYFSGVQCGKELKDQVPNQPWLFLEPPAPKWFFPTLWSLTQSKNGKHYRRGDGQAVRSWDCYLMINHRGPEVGLGCFKQHLPWGFQVSLLGQAGSTVIDLKSLSTSCQSVTLSFILFTKSWAWYLGNSKLSITKLWKVVKYVFSELQITLVQWISVL